MTWLKWCIQIWGLHLDLINASRWYKTNGPWIKDNVNKNSRTPEEESNMAKAQLMTMRIVQHCEFLMNPNVRMRWKVNKQTNHSLRRCIRSITKSLDLTCSDCISESTFPLGFSVACQVEIFLLLARASALAPLLAPPLVAPRLLCQRARDFSAEHSAFLHTAMMITWVPLEGSLSWYNRLYG